MDVLSANTESLRTPSANSLAALRGNRGVTRAQMEDKAKDFEAVFMAQMLKPMWEGVETDPMFGGGTGEDVMRDMLIQEYGKAMAQADDYGLAKDVLAEMIRIQEQAQTQTGATAP